MSTGKGNPLPFGLQGLLPRLRASYWFVPLLVTLAGVGLAFGLLAVDAGYEFNPPSAFWLVYPTSPEGARELLSAVIGSMITAISVTFSITIVALTVAAQHFGPRVLNNFIRHTSAQVVLGTFIATFVYAVLVLGSISGSGEDADIPQLAVIGAVALVILSVGALIFYVHHVSTALQVGEIAAEIATDLTGSLADRDEDEAPAGPVDLPEPPGDAAGVPSVRAGYVQRIDHEALVALARERDAVIWIRREPGKFSLTGAPLVLVHPPSARDEPFVAAVLEAFAIGQDRSHVQDVEFSVKQLVEVALRALSPGVNEPFTALTCIDRLSEGLACAAVAPAPPASWRDADGRARVFMQPQPFTMLLRAAFDPIRMFAGRNPAVHARLLDSIGELSYVARRAGDLEALRHQADVVWRAAAGALEEPDDRAFVEERYRRAMARFEPAA